jgi:hypothetical protein
VTFTEWDAANRDALWNGGKTPLREQYRAVWNAAIEAAMRQADDCSSCRIAQECYDETEPPSEDSPR